MRAVLFAVFALAACAEAPRPVTDPGTTASANAPLETQIRTDNERFDRELSADGVVSAGIGETADLGGGLIVKPLEVLEDSRCPMNVVCVWAGRLRLRAEVAGAVQELTLGQALETPKGTVVLAVASPSAWAEWPGGRPAYRFGFRRA